MISGSTSGINFGWRCYEGSSEFDLTGCPDMNLLTFPIAEYTHNTSGNFKCSITGGYVHRGTIHTDLNGYYFFADYCSNEIGTINFDGGNFTINYSDQFTGNNWTAFGEDLNGELYIAGVTSGEIFKIIPGNLSNEEFSDASVKMQPNPTADILNFNFKSHAMPSEINIYDMQGKLIDTHDHFFNNSAQISTKNYSKGLYLVRIYFNNGNIVYKKLVTR
jgi:hypothetical protein